MLSRIERVNQSLKKALGEILIELLPEVHPLTVSDVLIDPSLKHAKVYLTTDKANLAKAEHERVKIQNMINHRLKLRNTPVLTFIKDDDYLEKIDTLIDQTKIK